MGATAPLLISARGQWAKGPAGERARAPVRLGGGRERAVALSGSPSYPSLGAGVLRGNSEISGKGQIRGRDLQVRVEGQVG